MPATLLAFSGLPGGTEWIVLLVLGLLIFGRRLPEVGRSLGKGIVEFKKGIKGFEDDIDEASAPPSSLPDQSRSGNTAGGQLPNDIPATPVETTGSHAIRDAAASTPFEPQKETGPSNG